MASREQTQPGGKSEQQSSPKQQSSQQQSSQQRPQAMRMAGGQRQQAGLSRGGQFAPLLGASPFTLMRRFNEEMGRLFEDFIIGSGSRMRGFPDVGQGLMPRGLADVATWSPQIEVFERDNQLIVRADLPGVDRGDVQVEIRDDAVVIQGERREEREEQRGNYYVSEVARGSFYREIPLPEGVNTDNATAVFRDGVLEIVIPEMQQESRRRQLEVKEAPPTGQQAQAQTQAAGKKS
jgi:HSP20 family protein